MTTQEDSASLRIADQWIAMASKGGHVADLLSAIYLSHGILGEGSPEEHRRVVAKTLEEASDQFLVETLDKLEAEGKVRASENNS
jgi:hypothetical protein